MNELVRRMASVSLRKVSLPIAPTRTLSSLSLVVSPGMNAGASYVPSFLTLHRKQFSSEVTKSSLPPSSIITDEASGKNYGLLLDTRNLPKLKPSLVQKRLANCKTYEGRELNIRQSPWKLNRICQLAAGLTLEEALTQLKFCDLKNADLVAKVLKRTSNLADIRDGIQMSQLEVAECFTNKGRYLRRMRVMGRGRTGNMVHKFANIRVVLREIDFPLRIYQQTSLNQKKKWLKHQQRAEQDARAAKAKRDEILRLEKEQQEQLHRKAQEHE